MLLQTIIDISCTILQTEFISIWGFQVLLDIWHELIRATSI